MLQTKCRLIRVSSKNSTSLFTINRGHLTKNCKVVESKRMFSTKTVQIQQKSQSPDQQRHQLQQQNEKQKQRLNQLQVEPAIQLEQVYDQQFIKASEDKRRQDRNYQLLISDCHEQVKFLNQVPLSVLEQSLTHFRKHVFSQSERKQIPHLIYQVLERELIIEEDQGSPESINDRKSVIQMTGHSVDQQDLLETAKQIYHALQVVLEFMDKGVKGLLVGDLSTSLLIEIQKSIGKYENKCQKVYNQIQNLLEKNQTLEKFIEKYFTIENMHQKQAGDVYQQNIPKYSNYIHNFQDFLVTIDKKDWQNQIKIKFDTDYYKQDHKQGNEILAVNFQDPINMQTFIDKKAQSVKDENEEKLQELKQEINHIINTLYEEVAHVAMSMDKYRVPIHGIDNPEMENPVNMFKRQLKLEQLSFDLSHSKYKLQLDQLIKSGKADQLATSHRYILTWMKILETAIIEQQKIATKRGQMDPTKIGYYLMSLPSDQIATLCVLHLMRHLFQEFVEDTHKDSERNSQQRDVQTGTGVQEVKILAVQLFDELGKLFDRELKQRITGTKNSKKQNPQNKDKTTVEQHLLIEDHSIGTMDRNMQLKVGAFLTNLMCKNLKYKVGNQNFLLLQPQVIRQKGTFSKPGKYMGYVSFNKAFVETFIGELDKIHDMNLQLERSLPMIYPPAPWKNFYFGGYYLKQTKMAKVMPNFKEAVNYLCRSNMKPMCEVLDILGSVQWRLNVRILEMMEYVWSIGGGLGEIPKRYNERIITPEILKEAPFREKLKLLKEHQSNKENHSLRCEWLLRMQIAQSFKSCNAIYFPHNCDFRGRVYPVPPHLNHMGPDINRGMLEFSQGKKLQENGLFWLKVHLANKFGKDKLPLKERAEYSESIMETVHRIADDPKNNLDWLQAENPWQALACIFDLSRAMRTENPSDYLSHLHVHVDGSCNGMQHYAAFGRDEAGGRQVNLAESDRPGDVYTAILKLVIKDIENEKNPEYVEIAESLKGKVSRKVIKQTVMTSVYGVTFIGARAQIQRQLKERKLFETNGELYRASNYLAKMTIKCIGDLFSDANLIKDWFAKCAKIVASSGEPVKWVSPVGLPCVQPYKYVSSTTIIQTMLQSLSTSESIDDQPVNKQKNTTAFPPNFVHSIDSTHMMLTALKCKDAGIIFAAVHDSYWTHPSDINNMNKILRDQFVELHSSPLISNLNENFQSRYPHEKFPEIPKQGTFNLESVKESTYFFS